MLGCIFFFSSRRRHTRCSRDWSSDVCSSDLYLIAETRLIPIVHPTSAYPISPISTSSGRVTFGRPHLSLFPQPSPGSPLHSAHPPSLLSPVPFLFHRICSLVSSWFRYFSIPPCPMLMKIRI